jgi:CheY-like chemotaxis protein
MANGTTWQLLFVDDDAETCRQVGEYLDGEVIAAPEGRLRVTTLTDFAAALNELERRRFDLLILDVRLGPYEEMQEEEAGVMALQAIQQRCFVPVVFYTGLPHLVRDLETPLIRVVEKTEGLSYLLETVRNIFTTRLPAVNRALIRLLETVQRDYMWDFVATHWERFGDTPDRTALAYLLARRLAVSLAGPGIRQLVLDLGDPTGTAAVKGRVHPMQYYVMPPVESAPLTGDLYHGQIEGQAGHWVLLTPSCDLVMGRGKAEWVLLARCAPLTEQVEYQKWQSSLPQPSRTSEKNLRALLQDNRQDGQPDRFYFLPGALALPDLIVDFQQLVTLPRGQMDSLKRVASLDSPFAEALLARFGRYFGRLGTPDLDVEVLVARLRSGVGQGV